MEANNMPYCSSKPAGNEGLMSTNFKRIETCLLAHSNYALNISKFFENVFREIFPKWQLNAGHCFGLKYN